MKNILPILVVVLCFSYLAGQAQTTLDNSEYYRIHYIKYQHGTATKATKIGTKFFSNSLNKLGINVKVLKMESGPYDLMVIAPVKSNSPFKDDHTAEMTKIMAEIAGSDATLKAELDAYASMVIREDYNYYRNIDNTVFDNSTAYRIRNIKYHQGKEKVGTAVGTKYFTGALRKLGINISLLQAKTGAYDMMVIEPITLSSPFKDPHAKEFGKHMLEIAGSQEVLSQAFKDYNDAVYIEDLQYLSDTDN